MKYTFGLSPEELKNQVDNYSSLTVFKSYRGISAMLLLILAHFVYKGKKWAFIAAMIVWSIEKIYATMAMPSQAIVQILWWYFYIQTFHRGWQVEKARAIGSVAPPPPPPTETVST
jgi:hypothetical protein